jgi:hypothetical protein
MNRKLVGTIAWIAAVLGSLYPCGELRWRKRGRFDETERTASRSNQHKITMEWITNHRHRKEP